MPKAPKQIMSERPVTISALSNGMLLSVRLTVRQRRLMAMMPTQAATPMRVAMTEESTAMESELYRALMIVGLWKTWAYQSSVKPPHAARDLLTLKLSTMSTRIGR